MSSPVAITRARVRSLTSPTSATPAAICRSSCRCFSTSPIGDAQLGGEPVMPLFDGAQLFVVGSDERGVEQPFESIGDASDGGMHDQHARAVVGSRRWRLWQCCASWSAKKRSYRRTSERSRQRPCGSLRFSFVIGVKTPSARMSQPGLGPHFPRARPRMVGTRSARPALRAPGKKRRFMPGA